jgi:hypothetical protein
MKDSRIEVIFSERDFKFFEQYSKENHVHINEVIRTNLAEWLREWESSDDHVYLRKGSGNCPREERW